MAKYIFKLSSHIVGYSIEYFNNDDKRLDNMPDFISLSITRPNQYLLEEFHNEVNMTFIRFVNKTSKASKYIGFQIK